MLKAICKISKLLRVVNYDFCLGVQTSVDLLRAMLFLKRAFADLDL